jgi:cobalt-zinc-cadmium efflux system membrane fusion protein
MAHVQVVTVEPATLTRTLRLTGAVEYNAFNTTPVITQVGGPVSRILVVPGEHVRSAGQPMLEVSSPDYSQFLDAYLKAADSSRLAEKTTPAPRSCISTTPSLKRDLEQAESDRNQAQADLNAAEQGMKILGIKNPASLATARPRRKFRCWLPSAAKSSSGWSRRARWCRPARRRPLPSPI